MIKVTYSWNGQAEEEAVLKAGWEKIRRAAHYFWDRVHDELNVPNTGKSVGKKGHRHTVYPNPSKPGEPPRKRTGWLQRHVLEQYDQNKLEAIVGLATAAIYGLFLELGTRRMRARPWLLATLKKYWGQMQAIAS